MQKIKFQNTIFGDGSCFQVQSYNTKILLSRALNSLMFWQIESVSTHTIFVFFTAKAPPGTSAHGILDGSEMGQGCTLLHTHLPKGEAESILNSRWSWRELSSASLVPCTQMSSTTPYSVIASIYVGCNADAPPSASTLVGSA